MSINRLYSELKKIQSKISTLEINESMGGDAEIEEKIFKLEPGVSSYYSVNLIIL